MLSHVPGDGGGSTTKLYDLTVTVDAISSTTASTGRFAVLEKRLEDAFTTRVDQRLDDFRSLKDVSEKDLNTNCIRGPTRTCLPRRPRGLPS